MNLVVPGGAVTLAVIFIILKLTGFIAWTWVWVLSPVWIALIISLVLALLGVKVKK